MNPTARHAAGYARRYTYMRDVSAVIHSDCVSDGDSIPSWTSAAVTAWQNVKLKTCFDGPWKIDRDVKDRGSLWVGPPQDGVPTWAQGLEGASAAPQEEAMKQAKYPAGWDEERVQRVLEIYETQSDEEAVAEDEAAYEATTHTAMEVPVDLVPAVRELIAKRRAG